MPPKKRADQTAAMLPPTVIPAKAAKLEAASSGLMKRSSFASFESWKQLVFAESRNYYQERSEGYMEKQWDRVQACLAHADCAAFQLQHSIAKGKTFWAYNPKETCDKFETFLRGKGKQLIIAQDDAKSKASGVKDSTAKDAPATSGNTTSTSSTGTVKHGEGVATPTLSSDPSTTTGEATQEAQENTRENCRAPAAAEHVTEKLEAPTTASGEASLPSLPDQVEETVLDEDKDQKPTDIENLPTLDVMLEVPCGDRASLPETYKALDIARNHNLFSAFCDKFGDFPEHFGEQPSDCFSKFEEFNKFLQDKGQVPIDLAGLKKEQHQFKEDNEKKELELRGLALALEEDLLALVSQASEHPLFNEFIQVLKNNNDSRVDNDCWSFGKENDPVQDFDDFNIFLGIRNQPLLDTKSLLPLRGLKKIHNPVGPYFSGPSPLKPGAPSTAIWDMTSAEIDEFEQSGGDAFEAALEACWHHPRMDEFRKFSCSFYELGDEEMKEWDHLELDDVKDFALWMHGRHAGQVNACDFDEPMCVTEGNNALDTPENKRLESEAAEMEAPHSTQTPLDASASSDGRSKIRKLETTCSRMTEFSETEVETFFSTLPAVPETLGSPDGISDPGSGACSGESADAHLGHMLSQYPDCGDIPGSTVKVMGALLLKHHVETKGSEIRDNLQSHPNRLQVGSICSGTGAFEVCIQAVATYLGKAFGLHPLEVQNMFGSECVKFKAHYCLANATDECCMFKDALRLREDSQRHCMVHGDACELQPLDGFAAGFSCTSYSMLNKDALKNATAMDRAAKADPEARVASVDTFEACMDVLDASRPLWTILENVVTIDREVDSETRTNLDLCLEALSERGYHAQAFVLDAAWYGLPQSRKRLYIVCLDATADTISTNSKDFFSNVRTLLQKLHIKPPPVAKFLLNDNDPAVLAYLKKLQEKDAGKEEKEKEGSWVNLHMNIAEKRNIQWPLAIPCQITASKWFKTLTARAKEVLGFAADDKYRLGKDLSFCDVYHSANRFSTGSSLVPIVLPRTILWSFDRQRLILGREALMLQGQSVNLDAASELTESQLQDLSGNAFAGNVLIAVIISILASLKFTSPSEAEETDEIELLVSHLTHAGNSKSGNSGKRKAG